VYKRHVLHDLLIISVAIKLLYETVSAQKSSTTGSGAGACNFLHDKSTTPQTTANPNIFFIFKF